MRPIPHPSFRTVLAAAAVLLLAAAQARAQDVVRVSGTGTALGTMRQLAEAFEKAHPGSQVKVFPSVGSSGALKAVADGALDIGLSGRPLKPEEQALGLVATAYARTPFVFAVGPRTGVTGVTESEVARIYRGEVPTWPNGERVRLVVRPRAEADTALLRTISKEMDAAVEAALQREGMLVAVTNQECNETVARTPGAIGPSSLTQIVTERAAVTPLAWNGVAPTVEAGLERRGAHGGEPRLRRLSAHEDAPPRRAHVAHAGRPALRGVPALARGAADPGAHGQPPPAAALPRVGRWPRAEGLPGN
jgi:phosphate transport system substrate-binding protein